MVSKPSVRSNVAVGLPNILFQHSTVQM